MSRRFFGGLLAATLVAGLGGVAAPAEATEVQATIPFGFKVDNMALPPGVYHVMARQTVVILRGQHGGAMTMTTALHSSTRGKAGLVFYKYGEEYFLRRVLTGEGLGWELLRAPAPEAGRRDGNPVRPASTVVSIPAL